MNEKDKNALGAVIAVREYGLKDGKKVVSIGQPLRFTGANDYYCPYQIVGIGDGLVQRASGVDAVQALIHALKAIGVRIVSSSEYQAGEVIWFGRKIEMDEFGILPEIPLPKQT